MELIDRAPAFWRGRFTRCASCGHEAVFDDDWFESWARGDQVRPGCGIDCSQEHATCVAAAPGDPALDD